MIDVLTAIAFGGIALAVFLAARWFQRSPAKTVESRLPRRDVDNSGAARWFGDELTEDLAGQVPQIGSRSSELEADLRHAGYFQPTAIRDFLALRNFLTLAVAVVGGTWSRLALAMQRGWDEGARDDGSGGRDG